MKYTDEEIELLAEKWCDINAEAYNAQYGAFIAGFKKALSLFAVSGQLPPSELIALKEYYDKKWKGASGCRSQEQVDAQKISENIEKRLADMVVNFR